MTEKSIKIVLEFLLWKIWTENNMKKRKFVSDVGPLNNFFRDTGKLIRKLHVKYKDIV